MKEASTHEKRLHIATTNMPAEQEAVRLQEQVTQLKIQLQKKNKACAKLERELADERSGQKASLSWTLICTI